MSTPEQRIVTHGQLAEIYDAAWEQVRNTENSFGAIDANVPWEAANIYMQAIQQNTGHMPRCDCLGAFGRITLDARP